MGDTALRRYDSELVLGVYKVIYAGETELGFGITDDDPRWTIWKYTWDGNNELASIEELHGAWDDRTTLPWTT